MQDVLLDLNDQPFNEALDAIVSAVKNERSIYIFGNGGSSANAEHITNDFMLGLNKNKLGLRIINLSSNSAKLTCIANDLDYEQVYSHQIKILARKNDLLILLSGSGNSKNILNAINVAKKINVKTFSILGYDGGKAKKISDYNFHFPINDMQISEDMQLILMNTVMKLIFFNE